jgi:putative cell wall-binding protein
MTPTRGRKARQRTLVGIAVLALSAGTAGLSALPAFADSFVTVSGTVSLAQGATTVPSAHSLVDLVPIAGGGSEVTVATNPDGTFTSAPVAPGRYRVLFAMNDSADAQASTFANAPTWLGNTPYEDSSTVLTVGSSAVTGVDAVQPAASSISGTVTTSSSDPVDTGDQVDAYLLNSDNVIEQRIVGEAPVASDGTYTISQLNPGQYVLRFVDVSGDPTDATSYWTNDPSAWETPVSLAANTNLTGYNDEMGAWGWNSGRIAGADRFETAVQVSQAFYLNADNGNVAPNAIFIADGLNYPDALSASAAAAAVGGPVLFVTPTTVPAETRAEINRLQDPEIAVVGGTGAVGDGVYSQLSSLVGGNILRISGADRYATSRDIAAAVFEQSSIPTNTVFIATGANYPDALVAGSAAGYLEGPLILVNGSSSTLDAATTQLLTQLAPKRIYVVGGTGAVTSGVETALDAIPGVPEVKRLDGADRYTTAVAVNQEVFPFADNAFLATGTGFADAMAVSAIAGVTGSPLLLSTPTCIPQVSGDAAVNLGVSNFILVGGTGVLDNDVYLLRECATGDSGALSATSGQLHSSALSSSEGNLSHGSLPAPRTTLHKAGTRLLP